MSGAVTPVRAVLGCREPPNGLGRGDAGGAAATPYGACGGSGAGSRRVGRWIRRRCRSSRPGLWAGMRRRFPPMRRVGTTHVAPQSQRAVALGRASRSRPETRRRRTPEHGNRRTTAVGVAARAMRESGRSHCRWVLRLTPDEPSLAEEDVRSRFLAPREPAPPSGKTIPAR